MGYGDTLMAIGDAWKLYQANGGTRKIAIGDHNKLTHLDGLDAGLDFIARVEDLTSETEWVISAPGHRPYIDYQAMREKLRRHGHIIHKRSKLVTKLGHYIWRMDYRPTPAPVRLTDAELEIAEKLRARGPCVLIEPYTKAAAPINKQYPVDRMREAALALKKDLPVYQISHVSSPDLDPTIPRILTSSFRETLAYLKGASLYVGPEGGLHHGSAAMSTSAVVIFGGFISPQVTGYSFHTNLTGSAARACGTKTLDCPHCRLAFQNIPVDLVVNSARMRLVEVNAL